MVNADGNGPQEYVGNLYTYAESRKPTHLRDTDQYVADLCDEFAGPLPPSTILSVGVTQGPGVPPVAPKILKECRDMLGGVVYRARCEGVDLSWSPTGIRQRILEFVGPRVIEEPATIESMGIPTLLKGWVWRKGYALENGDPLVQVGTCGQIVPSHLVAPTLPPFLASGPFFPPWDRDKKCLADSFGVGAEFRDAVDRRPSREQFCALLPAEGPGYCGPALSAPALASGPPELSWFEAAEDGGLDGDVRAVRPVRPWLSGAEQLAEDESVDSLPDDDEQWM